MPAPSARLTVRLLGPVTVASGTGGDERSLSLGGERLRALLARLALSPGQPVAVGTLVEDLWGADPPASAGNALQALVSRLRRALDDSGAVDSTPAGYVLQVDPDDVDAHRFVRLAAAGHAVLARGEADTAAQQLREALSLWRGPVLADVTGAPFVEPAAARLDRLRLDAVEDRIAADLARGRHRDVVTELEGLVATYPLRERLRAQLITALAAAGRRSDALGRFDEGRTLLAEELGLDPSPELAAAHLAVLRGEVAPGTEADRTPPPDGAPTNLRTALTSFVGRTDEIKTVRDRLQTARLVTIIGPGGAGKTRLAAEAAAGLLGECPDGVWLVELASVGDPAEVAQAALTVLHIRDRMLSTAEQRSAVDNLQRLVTALRRRRLLIVLDNCEHLVDAAAELADTLLARCPDVRVLATSREALAVTGEALHPLGGLPADTAAQLFAERAAAVRPDFALAAGDDPYVAEICRRLDGLPLAIELAAARLRAMPLPEIARRLDDRFRLLTGGSRTALPRQQTLRAVVAWSWDLLAEPERALARRLAVFPAGATLAAAETVGAGGPVAAADVLDLLAALVDKSLVVALDGRYRMLETIRAYGSEALAAAGEAAIVRSAHARYFTELAEAAEPQLRGADQLDWLATIDVEYDNLLGGLRYAIDTTDAEMAVRMVAALVWFWILRGRHAEAAALIREALAVPGSAPDAARALAYLTLSMDLQSLGDWSGAMRALARSNLIARRLTVRPETPLLLMRPVVNHIIRRQPDEAIAYLQTVEDDAPNWTRAMISLAIAQLHENAGRPGDSAAELTRALDGFEVTGDRWGLGMSLMSTGQLRAQEGEHAAALAAYRRALTLVTELEAPEDIVHLAILMGTERMRSGDLAGAREELATAQRFGRLAHTRETRVMLAITESELARRSGDLVAARALLADLPAQGIEGTLDPFGTLLPLGRAALARLAGELDDAAVQIALAIEGAQRFGDQAVLATVLEQAAAVALADEDAELAAELLGAAHGRRGVPDRGDPDTVASTDAARAALGVAAFTTAYERGRVRSEESAVELIGQVRRR